MFPLLLLVGIVAGPNVSPVGDDMFVECISCEWLAVVKQAIGGHGGSVAGQPLKDLASACFHSVSPLSESKISLFSLSSVELVVDPIPELINVVVVARVDERAQRLSFSAESVC